jgi:hypothetical protein
MLPEDLRFILQSQPHSATEAHDLHVQQMLAKLYTELQNPASELHDRLQQLLDDLDLLTVPTVPTSILWSLRHQLCRQPIGLGDYHRGSYFHDQFKPLTRPLQGSDVMEVEVDSLLFTGFRREDLKIIAQHNVSHVMLIYSDSDGKRHQLNDQPEPLELYIRKDQYSTATEFRTPPKMGWMLVILVGILFLSIAFRRHQFYL